MRELEEDYRRRHQAIDEMQDKFLRRAKVFLFVLMLVLKVLLVVVVIMGFMMMLGCATPEPNIIRETQEVKIPYREPCKFEWPDKPNNYVVILLPEAKREEKLKAALAEREELKAYVPQIEGILRKCAK